MKRDFNYPSKDGRTMIHAIEWKPEGEVLAVVQIVHGMCEFVNRYDRFAKYLNEKGIYVTGNDHLGHGASVVDDEMHGYFAEKDGNGCVIGDIQSLREMTQKKYPEVPYFILGHSMGSFLTRQYLTMYGEGLAGAIISGTAYQSPAALAAGKAMCRSIARFRGWKHRSKTVNNMALGSYNKAFEPARTPNDWLTKDMRIVDDYCANPWDNFVFTLNAYYNLFVGLEKAEKQENINRIPKTLPIFVVAGGDDPVGNCGEGPRKVAEIYRKSGIRDTQVKIYPEDRHEILNETDHDEVDRDLLKWMITKGKLDIKI
ncbi:MAG: lysophospholipase [Eubacterium sp.]|uniref:Lysophospholipase n=1 Tax=Eubacterium cellulosolvens (strain ATCC 43171 / JCM 9499 / 6) TaxID=633697 RepID=I5ATP5_EUBC6|nr:lysophospholipase [Eubacterium sp.]